MFLIKFAEWLLRQVENMNEFFLGSTNTAESLLITRRDIFSTDNGDRRDRENVVVLLTDGSSDDSAASVQEATYLKV